MFSRSAPVAARTATRSEDCRCDSTLPWIPIKEVAHSPSGTHFAPTCLVANPRRMRMMISLAVLATVLVSSAFANTNLHLDPPVTVNRAESGDESQCVTEDGRAGRCALKSSCQATDVDRLPTCYSLFSIFTTVCCPFNTNPGVEFRNVEGSRDFAS